MMYDYVVIEWGLPFVCFSSNSLDECYAYIDSQSNYYDLVVLFGKEDIPF